MTNYGRGSRPRRPAIGADPPHRAHRRDAVTRARARQAGARDDWLSPDRWMGIFRRFRRGGGVGFAGSRRRIGTTSPRSRSPLRGSLPRREGGAAAGGRAPRGGQADRDGTRERLVGARAPENSSMRFFGKEKVLPKVPMKGTPDHGRPRPRPRRVLYAPFRRQIPYVSLAARRPARVGVIQTYLNGIRAPRVRVDTVETVFVFSGSPSSGTRT